MEKSNRFIKSFLYIFFAVCFASFGFMFATKPSANKIALAEDVSQTEIDNQNIPDYFSAQEYLFDGTESTENPSSLIDSDTFLYFSENSTSNYLTLSLATNGNELSPQNDIYNFVYYPDLENTSVFYFYSIDSVSLSINGQDQDINMGDYISYSGFTFPNNHSAAQPQQFNMTFTRLPDGGAEALENNEIAITDEDGNVIEGIYSLSLTYTLYTCTDGGTNMQETAFSDQIVTVNYSFYVVDRAEYFFNNRPNIVYNSFDHDIALSGTSDMQNAFYLYSNYSAEDNTNSIPYIEYDYTKFELNIEKKLSNTTYNAHLQYDKDASSPSPVYTSGDDIVHTELDTESKTCRVYFTDVGNYTLSFDAIQIVDFSIDADTQVRKYALDGVTSITKNVLVYMYGYQANYTDMDKPTDENNIRQISELKEYDFENGRFENSADITSEFLASNENYSQTTGNTTFNISNVLNYINTNNIQPVQTDQTPIRLTSNASLVQSQTLRSYIYSTTRVSSAYEQGNFGSIVSGENAQQLYRTTFEGRTDSTAGKYIYIIAYTFDNYYLNEGTLSANTVFYQVFYFEIVKDLPSIAVMTTESGKNVPSDTFVNENVNIVNTTLDNPFNQDVTIQIYAYDYDSNTYMSDFGGTSGISWNTLLASDNEENFVTLDRSAFYTVRLYFSNQVTASNLLITSNSGYFREQTFTIDKNPLENITARNVTEITNSTNYRVVSTLSTFTTNQSVVLSWNEKASGARTFAYYRYFPIIDGQYYSNRPAVLSETLRVLLRYSTEDSFLPVNNLLNMSTTNNNWLPYQGNTIEFDSTVSTEYVLSDAGLYLVDVYDEAGNHSIEVYMIDTTTPYFAIFDGQSYELTSSSVYVTTPSTLYWAKNKAIYIVNFRTLSYTSSINPDNITVDDLTYDGTHFYDFYLTYDGTPCTDIFSVIYNKLYSNGYMRSLNNINITISPETDGTSNLFNGYNGLYITIPINSTSYYIDREHASYTAQTDVYSRAITVNEEMIYRVLIRDMSNTRMDTAYDPNNVIQYTNYYSARQTIIISFDSSEFFIEFENEQGETEVLTSNNVVEGTIATNDGISRQTKTTYLSPTRMNKAFVLSFIPTITNEDMLIQVDSVIIKYYPYIEITNTIGDITYHSYTLSDSATEINVYDFTENGAITEVQQEEIRLNANNVTMEGKYEIVRTYYIDEGYSYNENDFYQRTYVFYVDRNEVVTNAELVSDENGSHLESLVGGDIFVSMYDNGTNASLVVTFPNSEEGNTNGSSLYNNGTVRSILTTNLLPVYVYVPQYKYTSYTIKTAMLANGTILYNDEALQEETNIVLNSGAKVTVLSATEQTAKIVHEDEIYYIAVSQIASYDFEVQYEDYHVLNVQTTLYNDSTLLTPSDETLPAGTIIDIVASTADSTQIRYNSQLYFIANNSYTLANEDNFYFGSSLIREYALYAEIYKDGTETANLVAVTSTNPRNPTLETTTTDGSGFLNFYNYNDGSKFEYLSQEGTYYVRIYQGRYGTEVGENNYQQYLTFSFEIQRSNPDFVVQSTSNSVLNSITASPAPSVDTQPSMTYYTNQSVVTLVWEAGSTYMADIDIDEIVFRSFDGTTFHVSDDVFAQSPTLSGNNYVAQLDLQKLGVYTNGGYVDITMQFKNHDARFYSRVTKRVAVDLSAPSTNVQNLVTNSTSGNLIAPLTNSALRTYYTADMEQTDDLTNTSYNISNNTGTFAYYSYSVTADFLQTLKNSLGGDVFRTYIRAFVDTHGNNTKYTSQAEQETTPTNFFASNFDDITTVTTLSPDTYYEVVEMDIAGNMAIYTIYVTAYTSSTVEGSDFNNLITYTDGDGQEHSYTIDDYLLTQSYQNATNTIYARTGFTLENINFFGDAWAQIRLITVSATGVSTTRYLMLTPWDRGFAYAFVGQNYTRIAIGDLVDGSISSRYKNTIAIYNRQNLTTTNFYLNIRNTSLTANLTDSQNREFIRFAQPSDSAIQNTIYGSTFVTHLQITANDEIIYDQTNELGFASLWQSNSNVTVTYDATLGTITFEINPSLGFVSNTRIVYNYADNFGTQYREIHLYRETLITQEVTSQQDLYSYYDTTNGRLYYITKNGLQYHYNPNKYTVEIFDLVDGEIADTLTNATISSSQNGQGVTTILVSTTNTTNFYNDNFAIVVRDFNNADTNTNLVKTLYFTLYNQLPQANNTTANNLPGQFKILDANRNNVTQNIIEGSGSEDSGYFSEVTIQYAQQETFIPVVYSISRDGVNWTEITSGTRLVCQSNEMETYYLKIWYDETYLDNEMGTPEYVFGYVPASQIYQFNLSSLTATYWIEKTIDGVTSIVERSDTVYETPTGGHFANHYIVNVGYADRDLVTIQTNQEQDITATRVEVYTDSSTVTSELWTISNMGSTDLGNIAPFNSNIVITYIPNSDNFVDEFYTYNMNGIIDTSNNLVNDSSKSVVVSQDYSSIDRIELQWSSYYGIPQNEINIRLVKDGVELFPVVYSRRTNNRDYNYIYLTHSGHYTISLYDNAGNVQRFNRGSSGQTEQFSFIFLKDVPFTVTYIDPVSGQEQTTLPIKQAIYNGTVTLNIDPNTRSEFYSLDGYPVITVRKDGQDYTGTFTDDTTYIFDEPGYYEVYFSATSNIPDVGPIRQETYQFTILNPNEYRYSYIYNRYSNYYIERVLKNDVDITDQLLRTLDVSTLTINGRTYMAELPLSYLDEKTGSGTYLITVNSNDRLFADSTLQTSFTYKVNIQVGTAPIRISIAEGSSTTDPITITFNRANIYSEMGESTVRILRSSGNSNTLYYTLDITDATDQTVSTQITNSGTYYIQILSPSGNLLYSYRVVKNEPLNAAAIIAIVIAALVVVAVIIIIVKLRKRIRVK